MFNLGFSEIVIIGVLALLLIGPKQLPEMARVLGRMMNEFKKATQDLSGGLLHIKDELQKPMREGMEAFSKVQEEVIATLHEEKEETTEKTIKMNLEDLSSEDTSVSDKKGNDGSVNEG